MAAEATSDAFEDDSPKGLSSRVTYEISADNDDTARILQESSEEDEDEEEIIPSGSSKRYKCVPQWYTWSCALVAAIGGVLFGYDTGVIAGALLQLKNEFCLSDSDAEWVVSSLLLGAFVGSLCGGFLVDHIGRRVSIIVNAVVFIIGAAILAGAVGFPMLIVGRLIAGFGVSLSAVAEITYISEVAPAAKRGMLVSLNELGIVSGILAAYLVNIAFVDVEHGWRAMFALAILPAGVQGVLLLFFPNSPRFLVMRGKTDKAKQVLRQLRGKGNVSKELKEIEKDIQLSKNHSIVEVFSPRNNMLFRFFIGGGISVLQQASGQPSVLYYAPLLFEKLGVVGDLSATGVSVGLGLTKLVFTIICLLTVDRGGRRLFLLIGSSVMTICLLLVGILAVVTPALAELHQASTGENPCAVAMNDTINMTVTVSPFQNRNGSGEMTEEAGSEAPLGVVIVAAAALIVFVGAYSFSFGPVSWLVIGEIYPSGVRGRAVSMATSLNWLTNFIVSLTMLDIQDAIQGYSYFVYGAAAFISVVFIFVFVPETKNKSLEQISKELSKKESCIQIHKCQQPYSCWMACQKAKKSLRLKFLT